ncbi:hypothetical protein [Nitrosospira briensis]|uniref:hypothetical protein n=1 Tax=Nitrosospira briensis TaxID=35799 RepID=UPI0004697FFF|nr:hypothetical protein [Nitrosospira briensis]
MANQFLLKGHHIEVKYTVGITPGLIALTYKEGSVSRDFKTSEITTDQTALGSLVSVPLARSVDTGGTIFAFFLPNIEVARGQTADFTTVAIREEFSGPDSVPHRPTTWQTFVMHGTAQSVIVPL